MAASKKSSSVEVIANDIEYIKRDISEIKTSVTQGYVTKAEFEPIKRIVYGVVSLILIAVVGAVISSVVR